MTEDAWANYDFENLETHEEAAQRAVDKAKIWPYNPIPVDVVEDLLKELRLTRTLLTTTLERERQLQLVLSQVEADQTILSDEWAKKYADANNLLSAAQVQIQRLQAALEKK